MRRVFVLRYNAKNRKEAATEFTRERQRMDLAYCQVDEDEGSSSRDEAKPASKIGR